MQFFFTSSNLFLEALHLPNSNSVCYCFTQVHVRNVKFHIFKSLRNTKCKEKKDKNKFKFCPLLLTNSTLSSLEYTQTPFFSLLLYLFPLLVIPVSLLFSQRTTKHSPPYLHIFLISNVSIHVKLLLWKGIPLFTLTN